MIRFLLDENVPKAVQRQLMLHEPKMNVVCIGDEGVPQLSTPDEVILDWIAETGYILVSFNRRTMPEHLRDHFEQGKEMPGMLLVRSDTQVGDLVTELLLIWGAADKAEYANRIEYIP